MNIRKTHLVAISILIFSIFGFANLMQNSFSEHPPSNDFITKSLTDGTMVTIDYRDITNTSPQSTTLSIDPASPIVGDTVTVTVEEQDANLDILELDIVISSATSTTSGLAEATIQMTETGVNTGTFSGTLILSSSATTGNTLEIAPDDELNVSYEPESNGVGRLQIALDVATSGDVQISDELIDLDEFQVNQSFRPVTHPVQVVLQNGATLNDNAIVTISYANAVLKSNDFGIESQLNMYFKRDDVVVPLVGTFPFGWSIIRDQTAADPNSHDENAKTITSDLANTSFGINGNTILFGTIFGQPLTGGQFLIGFEQGIGGGGGGGLVRPGLVVNALAGIGAAFSGGGGGGPPGPTLTLGALAKYDSASEIISLPQEIRDAINNYDSYTILGSVADIYEDFDLPLSINGNGFVLGGYENTLERQTIQPGEPTEFKIVFYTNYEIAHTSLYFNLGPTRLIAGSDTQVLLYKDKFEIIDPNGNIASATGTINNEGDLKRVITFSITFSEDIQWSNSDLVIRAWNDNLSSGDTIVYDAIKVAPSEEEIAFEESLPEPKVEQLKSQYVPIWIKNNAAWWSQELIEDSDFIAGIEYLIQNEIITIQDNQVIASSYSSNEIPSWIKNNAGWWSDDLITEQEFIDGLQWLISNGIIQVTET